MHKQEENKQSNSKNIENWEKRRKKGEEGWKIELMSKGERSKVNENREETEEAKKVKGGKQRWNKRWKYGNKEEETYNRELRENKQTRMQKGEKEKQENE